MADTAIEWCDKVWNPIVGCAPKSDGCRFCYAERMAGRLSTITTTYEGLVRRTSQGWRWTGRTRFFPNRLQEPRRWRGTPRCFVNSMGDALHPSVEPAWLDMILEVIKATPHITYIWLTKYVENLPRLFYAEAPEAAVRLLREGEALPNLILGTSIESQAYVRRADALLAAWSGPTVVSAEPLLGLLDLTAPLAHGLSWVIAGGESGAGARPCPVEWLLALRNQCAAAGVPYFCKQLGAVWAKQHGGSDRKGATWALWPEDLRVREYPPRSPQLIPRKKR